MILNAKRIYETPDAVILELTCMSHFLQPVWLQTFQVWQKKNWILNFKQVER